MHEVAQPGHVFHGHCGLFAFADGGKSMLIHYAFVFQQAFRKFQAGPHHHALAVGVNIFDHIGTVHTHAHTVHDQALIINQVVIDPIDQLLGLRNSSVARQHNGSGTISGHVVERLIVPPRQHTRQAIPACRNVGLQRTQTFWGTKFAHSTSPGSRQRQPRFVVVVAVVGPAAKIAHPNSPHGVPDQLQALGGGASRRRVDQTIQVVRLPPVMPLHKQFVFDGRWPTHHSQVGPWNTPHAAGMPLVNGGFSKVGAVRPFFFHSVSPTRLVKYQRAGVSTHA